MKQRFISAIGGLVILFSIVSQYDTVVLNIAVSIIIMMAVDELVSAVGYKNNLMIRGVAVVFSGILSLLYNALVAENLPIMLFLFALVFLCILIKNHATISIEKLGFTLLLTLAIAFSINCFVNFRDEFGVAVGLYGVAVSLSGAWMGDSGAYFCGRLLGKKKLAPKISPKKTVEGAIGGIIVSLLGQLLTAYVFTHVASLLGVYVEVDILALALVAPVIAILSIIGDLAASVIKRKFSIKDFGVIMPGHGGVLDRFDSVLLVLPFVYILFLYHPLIRVIA